MTKPPTAFRHCCRRPLLRHIIRPTVQPVPKRYSPAFVFSNLASFEDTYAWILFKQKNYTDAKLWMEKALAHDKGHSAVQTEHYGDIMFYLGDTDAAVQNWKKAKVFIN